MPQASEPPFAVSVGFPDEAAEVPSARLLEIEEAVLSLTRACLAQGRRIVLPADPVVAPLVALTAAEYAEELHTEAVARPAPLVQVLLTEGRDEELTEALYGLDHVDLAEFGDLRKSRPGRQRLTDEALAELRPAAAVVFGGATESVDDLMVLRARQIPLHVIETALAGPLADHPDLGEYGIVGRALREVEWQAAGRDVIPDAEQAVPYPYVMQRLVEQWRPVDRPDLG
jgi:hypothetical protein